VSDLVHTRARDGLSARSLGRLTETEVLWRIKFVQGSLGTGWREETRRCGRGEYPLACASTWEK